jgi:hypothetical protein
VQLVICTGAGAMKSLHGRNRGEPHVAAGCAFPPGYRFAAPITSFARFGL